MSNSDLSIQISAINKASAELRRIKKDLLGLGVATDDVGKANGLARFTQDSTKARSAARNIITPAAIGGVVALGGALAYSVKQAQDAERVQAQLNAVLKSTGGVAGVTAKSVYETADALSQLTAYDDEAIVGAESLLLTFTKIGKDIFPAVTETVLDMSTALGQDLRSSAVQVGKALQDPVKGVTALQRVGVVLSKQQKQQIKDFIAVNDVASAQRVILQELQTEFGGSAKAAGQTFGGQLKILRTNLDNVAESIGKGILPALNDGTVGMNEFLRDHEADVERLARAFSVNLVGGIETTVDVLKDLRNAGGEAIESIAGIGDAQAEATAAAATLATAFAFLFPGAALVTGIAAVALTIGILTDSTDGASRAALEFRKKWLNAAADAIDAIAGVNEALAGGIIGKVIDVGELVAGQADPTRGVVSGKAADVARGGADKAIKGQSIFRVESERLRQKANEVTDAVKELDAAEEDLQYRAQGTGMELTRQAAATAKTGTATRSATAGILDALGATEGLTGANLGLTASENDLAAAVLGVNDLFNERTLADIGADAAIAETDAIISKYEELGQTVPAELVKWRDQLVKNRATVQDVAQAGALNFEELTRRIQDAGFDTAELNARLAEIPEESRVVFAAEAGEFLKTASEIEAFIDLIKSNPTLGVDLALRIAARYDEVQTERAGEVGNRVPGSRGYAKGGFVSAGKGEMAMLHGDELVLPLGDKKRSMDLLQQAGMRGFEGGGFLDLARGTFVPQGGSGSSGGSPVNEFALLAETLAAAGMSATEFTARMQLAEEQQRAVEEAQRLVNESSNQAAIDLTKLGIVLGEAGISGEAFVAQQGLMDLRKAFLESGMGLEEFTDAINGFTADMLARAAELARRTRGAIHSVNTGAEGYVDENGVRHTFGGNLTDKGLKKIRKKYPWIEDDDIRTTPKPGYMPTKAAAATTYNAPVVNNYYESADRSTVMGLR